MTPGSEARAYGPPAVWPVFVGFVVAIFGMFFVNAILMAGVIAVLYFRLHEIAVDAAAHWALSIGGLAASAGATGLVLAIVSVAGARMSGESVRTRLSLARSNAKHSHFAAAALATFAAGIVFSILSDFVAKDVGVLAQVTKSVMEASWPAWTISILGLAIMPGIAEELFFRGFVQTRAIARWGRWPGIALAAGLFGLIHMDLKQGTFAALVGLFLGWVATRARSIRPTMFAHGTSNFLSLFFGKLGFGPESTTAKLVTVAAATAVVAAVIVYIARHRDVDDPSSAIAAR